MPYRTQAHFVAGVDTLCPLRCHEEGWSLGLLGFLRAMPFSPNLLTRPLPDGPAGARVPGAKSK